jgi:hypothetical protein
MVVRMTYVLQCYHGIRNVYVLYTGMYYSYLVRTNDTTDHWYVSWCHTNGTLCHTGAYGSTYVYSIRF